MDERFFLFAGTLNGHHVLFPLGCSISLQNTGKTLDCFVESALGTMNPSSTISAIAENVELITF
jgi:hypothetical protein